MHFHISKGDWNFHIEDRDIAENEDCDFPNHIYIVKDKSHINTFPEFDKEADITPAIIEKFLREILDFFGKSGVFKG